MHERELDYMNNVYSDAIAIGRPYASMRSLRIHLIVLTFSFDQSDGDSFMFRLEFESKIART